MMNRRKKLIYVSLFAAVVINVTACSKKSDEVKNNSQNETTIGEATEKEDNAANKGLITNIPIDVSDFERLVVEVGKAKVYYSEAMIYFKYIQAQNEASFGNQIWDYQFGEKTFGEMAKNEIMNMIVQTKIIIDKAEVYQVVLTEEEEAFIQEKAVTFLSEITEEDKLTYGFTGEIVQSFYRDNLLYEKVYDASTMNVNTDVTDEEALQITVQYLFLPITETKDKAKELFKQAKKEENFYNYAQANTQDTVVEVTFGKGDKEDAFEKASFALKAGELSNIVETKDGYYIIYCVSEFNEDATLEKKEEIIAGRQDEEFQKLYKTWSKDYKIDVKDKVWDTMTFKKETTVD